MRLLLILKNFIKQLFKSVKKTKPIIKSKYESKDISRLDIDNKKDKLKY